jgi:hypothetical protein
MKAAILTLRGAMDPEAATALAEGGWALRGFGPAYGLGGDRLRGGEGAERLGLDPRRHGPNLAARRLGPAIRLIGGRFPLPGTGRGA